MRGGGVHPWNHVGKWENSTSWWACLFNVCFASKKSSEWDFFVLVWTHLGVKLLKSTVGRLAKNSFLLAFVECEH